jgi:cytochrome c oxidase assembly protein subunit 15
MTTILANAAPVDTRAPGARARLQVAAWLLACCALLFAMVVVGGVTRLTHSGLSIVEWQPILGTMPPMNAAQWLETFGKYQLTPEYQKVNQGMSLDAFKSIFWWEYFHRLLGRMIGFVFLLPLLWFWWRGRIDRPLALKFAGIFLLGALQGAMGWYMVKSGLVEDPRVSQYRLTAHLSIALAIYAAMLWAALGLIYPVTRGAVAPPASLRRFAWIITAIVAYMVVTGGFVAGIRAGFAYNTFPLMNGHLVPPEIFMLYTCPRNLFNNMPTLKYDHLSGASAPAWLYPRFWLKARRMALSPRARLTGHLLLGMLALQITLGIATLLLLVPIPLAAAHQGGAVLLLTAALLADHALR